MQMLVCFKNTVYAVYFVGVCTKHVQGHKITSTEIAEKSLYNIRLYILYGCIFFKLWEHLSANVGFFVFKKSVTISSHKDKWVRFLYIIYEYISVLFGEVLFVKYIITNDYKMFLYVYRLQSFMQGTFLSEIGMET